MFKIINSKKYNTETAKLIGRWKNNRSPDDTISIQESLYKKKNCKYFLYTIVKMMNIVNEDIIPLEYSDAKEWAMQKLPEDIYKIEFEEMPTKSEDIKYLTARVPEWMDRQLKREAQKRNMGVNTFLLSIYEEYLKINNINEEDVAMELNKEIWYKAMLELNSEKAESHLINSRLLDLIKLDLMNLKPDDNLILRQIFPLLDKEEQLKVLDKTSEQGFQWEF